MNAIDHRAWALVVYSPKTLYVQASLREWLKNEAGSSRKEAGAAKKMFGESWPALEADEKQKAIWVKKAADHDKEQPLIRPIIIDQLMCNRCTTFEGLSAATSWWCDAKTIERWLKSFDTYGMYRKEIKPGLTPQNQVPPYPYPTLK